MKSISTTLLLWVFLIFPVSAQDSLLIQGIKYRVDTLVQTHDVGLGNLHTKYSLPDFPLVVSVLEVDAANPLVKVMSCLSNDVLRGLERPSHMAARKSSPGHQVFGAINADFYITSGVDKGLSINGQILNGEVAKVPHASRPVIGFDNTKMPFLDVMTFSGSVRAGQQSHIINGVNVSRGAEQLILYNRYQGENTGTNIYGTEVEVELVEGEWTVNKTMRALVKQKTTGVGSASILPGRAILSGHGAGAAFLNTLEVDDEIELSTQFSLNSASFSLPHLKELVGGDRIILADGTITDNNWVQLHPRTGMGYSQDGSKVILTVVDGRSTVAAGVSTKQLADIMKQSGAHWALNLDGGGSSVMVVRDRISNTPSDGAERAVANAMLFVSTAPPALADSFALDRYSLSVPYGNKAKINASTFNEYDDVVDYLTAADVTFTLEGDIGSIDANGWFTATGTAYSGKIIGHWHGQSDTVHVSVLPVEKVTFKHQSITIDHLTDYTFTVYGEGEDNTPYLINNDLVQFESSNPAIGIVSEAGVFRGVSDGTVEVRVFTSDEEVADTCTMTVEIGRGEVLLDDFSNAGSWSVSKNWIDEVSLSRVLFPGTNEEVLKVDYSMTYANRTASITLEKTIDIYGMADSVLLQATGNGKSASFILMLDHAMGACVVPSFTGESMMNHYAAIRVEDIPQEDYPLSFKSVRLTIERDASYTVGSVYSGTFYLKSLKVVYPEKDPASSVMTPEVPSRVLVFPNPASTGVSVQLTGEGSGPLQLSLFALNGAKMGDWQLGELRKGDVARVALGNLPPGTYLYRISGRGTSEFGKLVISR